MLWLMWFAFKRCFSVRALFSGWASISWALTLGSLMPLALLAQLVKSGREGHRIWSMVCLAESRIYVRWMMMHFVAVVFSGGVSRRNGRFLRDGNDLPFA
jgi:hypothetical protein